MRIELDEACAEVTLQPEKSTPPRQTRPSPTSTPVCVVDLQSHRRKGTKPDHVLVDRTFAPFVRLLVVGADAEDVALMSDLLSRLDDAAIGITTLHDPAMALERIAAHDFDLVIVDADHDPSHAPWLLERTAGADLRTPVIVMSGSGERTLERSAEKLGAAGFIDKETDFEPGRLERSIRFAARGPGRNAANQQAQSPSANGRGYADGAWLFKQRLGFAIATARRLRTSTAVFLVENASTPDCASDHPSRAASRGILLGLQAALGQCVRETDAVCRLDDQRLGIVISHLARHDDCSIVASKIVDTISAWFRRRSPADGTDRVKIAIGAAVRENALDTDEMLEGAARAVGLVGKEFSSGAPNALRCTPCVRIRFDDAEDDRRMRETRELERDLRAAIDSNALCIEFQPQLTLGSPGLGLATVLSWTHADMGKLSGDAFTALVERTGLGELVTDWMLTAVCRQIRRWQQKGPRPFHVSLPVLSRRQFAWSEAPARVAERLQRFGLPRAMVELEVDEALLAHDIDDHRAAVERVRDIGIRLAVQRFAGRNGSLRLLHDAPLSTVKLAPSLMTGIPGEDRRSAFLSGTIRLCKDLGLRVVAEGVDRQEQLALLRRERCDAVQSLLSAPPLAADACAHWLMQASQRHPD